MKELKDLISKVLTKVEYMADTLIFLLEDSDKGFIAKDIKKIN